MSDFNFFVSASPRTLAALAAAAGLVLPASADPDLAVAGAAALDRAGPSQITVFEDGDDLDDLAATQAGVCLVPPWAAIHVPAQTIALVSDHPTAALRHAVAALYGDALRPKGVAGVSLDISARIDAEARLEQGAVIEAFVVIGAGVEIGSGTTVGAHSVVGGGVKIGRGCAIGSHVSLRNALIGNRVTIHSGTRVGFATPGAGPDHVQIGRVILQDDVEVGANATIARGGLCDTVVGEGTVIEAQAVIASQTAIDRRSRVRGGGFCLSSEMV